MDDRSSMEPSYPLKGGIKMTTNLAYKIPTPTEWIATDRRTGKRTIVIADRWATAASVGMRRLGVVELDDVEVAPHEAATDR